MDNNEKPNPQRTHIQEITAKAFKMPKNNVDVKVFEDKATGTKEGERHYGDVAAIKVKANGRKLHQPSFQDLMNMQNLVIKENSSFTRVFYVVREAPKKQPYAVGVRAIQTQDYLTAKVSEIPWKTLNEIAQKILAACSNVSSVSYDVTPKPPATIEME